MEIRIDNRDNSAEKSCFVDAGQLEIAAFPALDHFEIARMGVGDLGDCYNELWLNRKEFDELFDMMEKIKKLLEA